MKATYFPFLVVCLLGVVFIVVGAPATAYAQERCDGVDNDGDGMIDEDFPDLGTACTVGVGACRADGVKVCSADGTGTVCNAVPGEPSVEGPAGSASCFDAVDNDCDNLTDHQEAACQTAELCNGFDDDNDGVIDEDFADLGDTCTVGTGLCQRTGTTVCSADGASTQCSATPGAPGAELPGAGASCSDGLDNDCDGATDLADVSCQTAEVCDGNDNDGDGQVDEGFAGLGTDCTVGAGLCQRTGTTVCSADGASTQCSATPGAPAAELPTAGTRCSDGLDNDCDGLTDVPDDPSCQTAEVCDGLDNEGDGLVDEDFTDLGTACGAGIGACQADGERVCSADGTGTVCNAVPHLPSIEGPTGPTCFDGIDNDCDGFTDIGDSNCSAALLSVRCALPFIVGGPGVNCTGKHQIFFEPSGQSQNAVVSAELLALDTDGTLLATLPVELGDEAHLASRLDPLDFKATSKTNPKGTRHEVFAPIPLLRVTVNDGGVIAQAFCSNIPYLDVVEPTGDVVSVSEGDITLVRAAIPFVNPATLQVRVDGVDILASLGINPAVDFPNSTPFNGTVTIGGQPVEVEDLFVRTSGDFTVPSPNSLTMTLRNLGGGGHIIFVDGEPSFTLPPSGRQCHVDDIRDTGTVAGFGITIDSPAEGEVTSQVPTPVVGEVRHGRPIVNVQVNGLPLDVSGQVCTTGDGVTSADECVFPINVALDQTDLASAIPTRGGTFDPGSNRVIAAATDDLGNRAFATSVVAVGDVLRPGEAVRDALLSACLSEGCLDTTPTVRISTPGIRFDITEAQITPDGTSASVDGAFAPTTRDPEVEPTPGATQTPAPPPVPPVAGAEDALFVVADDTLNQLFAALTVQGAFKTTCRDSGKTINDLLPADCNSLSGANPAETAVLRGRCHGIKADIDCSALPIAQQPSCNQTQQTLADHNISASMPVQFCARQDIPPMFLIPDDPATASVEATLRLNDLLFPMVLDRNADGADPGPLTSLPGCAQPGADTTGDCKLGALCLDLNLVASMEVATSPGEPRINVTDVQADPLGVACGGALSVPVPLDVVVQSSPIHDLLNALATLPLQLQADLGDFLTCRNPRLIATETGGDPTLRDYLGITCNIGLPH